MIRIVIDEYYTNKLQLNLMIQFSNPNWFDIPILKGLPESPIYIQSVADNFEFACNILELKSDCF